MHVALLTLLSAIAASYYLMLRGVRAFERDEVVSKDLSDLASRLQALEDENLALTESIDRWTDNLEFTDQLLSQPGRPAPPPS